MIPVSRSLPALIVVTALGFFACSKEPAPPAQTAAPAEAVGGFTPPSPGVSVERPNLVLITLEATRADHLGCYGQSTAKTPAIDQLSQEGATFEQTIATAPLTIPSVASLLTGTYPPRHGVRDNTGFTLDAAQTTLAEHLKAQGFATAAAVGSRLLASDSGLKQGFDTYAQPTHGSRTAAFVVNDAIEAVNRIKGSAFFLWVQLDDPHAPYTPPGAFRTSFAGRLYDGEIAWVDVQLKRLFDHLENQGVFDNSIIVVTAAQGEGLGEHGEETHGLLLYDATLKVPLLVRYPPRVKAGTRSKRLVSLIDVVPSLLTVMGLPPLPSSEGRSFSPALINGDTAERGEPVYAESLFGAKAYGWAPLHAIRSIGAKLIDGPQPELYNIKRDPSETIDLAANDPTAVASLRPQLDSVMRTIGVPPGEAVAAAGGRDPKSLVAASNLFLKAQTAVEEGHPEQATPLLGQALAKDPGNPAAKALLAALRGEPVVQAAGAPPTFAGQWNLGNAHYVKGELDGAAQAFRAALALNPNSAETHYALGNVLADQGDVGGAEKELKAAVAANPKMADGWNKLGILLDKQKRRPEALQAFTKSLEANPDHADALFNRAKLDLLADSLADARRDLDRLLTAHPDYAAARYLEAHLCIAEKNPAGAKAALTKFLALPNIDTRMKASAQDMLAKING